jgi:hypothetical protein
MTTRYFSQNNITMLNEQDLKQIEEKGITKEVFLEQINSFKQGFPPLNLDRPATAGDGIRVFDNDDIKKLVDHFDRFGNDYKMLKFVPASGAASRMFKDVFAWRDLLKAGVGVEELLHGKPAAAEFFGRMRENAFWDDLKVVMDKDDLDADHLLDNKNFLPLLEYLLFDPGLDYADLPKALIAFHSYDQNVRTSMEEHLVEGAFYISNKNDKVQIHFTLSPEHTGSFEAKLESVRQKYENRYSVKYNVKWSLQKPSTDTIAVGSDNLPFREKDGSLLFRPGGHGALIENLQDLRNDDIIFIKNIDNVVPDRLKEQTITWKKVLGGLLIKLQQEVFKLLHRLDEGNLTPNEYSAAVGFCTDELCLDKNAFPDDPGKGSMVLKRLLNRPIRVCGMVKNEGEPGGGPFWVTNEQGINSLQIVEMSQINMEDSQQAALVEGASHFNPVDLVCSIKDYRGELFDLQNHIDQNTGFISHKSKDGRELKALERPGLWNGAMADWNTVFVEVPLITFNPVKTINDLLRPEHT